MISSFGHGIPLFVTDPVLVWLRLYRYCTRVLVLTRCDNVKAAFGRLLKGLPHYPTVSDITDWNDRTQTYLSTVLYEYSYTIIQLPGVRGQPSLPHKKKADRELAYRTEMSRPQQPTTHSVRVEEPSAGLKAKNLASHLLNARLHQLVRGILLVRREKKGEESSRVTAREGCHFESGIPHPPPFHHLIKGLWRTPGGKSKRDACTANTERKKNLKKRNYAPAPQPPCHHHPYLTMHPVSTQCVRVK
ncbi:unnamed protein product [Tuber melanosporum]|uniref:(Perigord truffle) hypothetical protein n=1 Tax=Tuber melanosporum (strain Mel28) TaxID=656061 RepID=D5GAA4_TUBMM|nr:uncharacterized protein GSTUM_00005202001 [Tuber melanosporum]CAZ81458.1 unnamed protein product [Tuber melanosporum]